VTAPRTLPKHFALPTERPIVAVFGSSTLTRDEPGWAVAHALGERLAAAGCAVMNGGYGGAMEAVSEGAALGGAPVIGVTTSLFNHRPANPHLSHREDTSTLLDRLDYLLHVASAFVVLEGSIGTMAELFLAWNLLAVEGRPAAPLVCLGEPYAEFLKALTRPGLVVPELVRFVEVATSPEDAVRRVMAGIASAGRSAL
jgi:hypothetical protein